MKAFVSVGKLACAAAVLAAAFAASPAAAQRGNSGLPPSPVNPLADLQSQITVLQSTIAVIQGQTTGLQSQITSLQSQIDALTPPPTALMWINHLDLVAGDTDVLTSFNATSSGVGGGLSGLIIQSSTAGDVSVSGGNKSVEKGLEVPPGWKITGVRVCYELSNARSFITQIRLDQVQPVPSTAVVLLDDATDQTAPGPVCVDSTSLPTAFAIDPSTGGVRLNLRVNFDAAGVVGAGADRIVVRAVGLHLFRP
jgi:hypothetical protein